MKRSMFKGGAGRTRNCQVDADESHYSNSSEAEVGVAKSILFLNTRKHQANLQKIQPYFQGVQIPAHFLWPAA